MPRKSQTEHKLKTPRDGYDSAWKEAISRYLAEFLALLFPDAFAQIDWTRPPEQLDTELRRVVRDAVSGDRRADLLFKVYLKDGGERYILAHIEIQTTKDQQLSERMFRYCHRIFDRYRHYVAAFAALGDEHRDWKPGSFGWDVLGSKLTWEFQTAKLLEWESRWSELEASRNPFATLLMAHLKTKGTRKDPERRLEWKLRITEHIYANYPGAEGRELLRLIDWMLQLPEEQSIIYQEELEALDAEQQMAYIPSFARKHYNEGLAEGQVNLLARQLEKRFGPLPSATTEMLQKAETAKVEQWGLRLLDARSLDEVFAGPPATTVPQRRRGKRLEA